MKLRQLISICVALMVSIINYAQTNKAFSFLESFTDGESAHVSIFADGNIQGLITDSENNSGTVATGAIGISVVKKKVIWIAAINIASTTDTISTGFGTVVLTPNAGKGFTSGILEFYHKETFKVFNKNIGIHGYASASSSKWLVQDTTKSATVVGLGLTAVNEIIAGNKGENSVYLGFEIGPTYRGVFGDISNSESLYENALGTKGNHFLGFEGGLKIRFNKITAGLQGFLLWDVENKQKIDGITSFQITGGITISGAIFQETFPTNN